MQIAVLSKSINNKLIEKAIVNKLASRERDICRK